MPLTGRRDGDRTNRDRVPERQPALVGEEHERDAVLERYSQLVSTCKTRLFGCVSGFIIPLSRRKGDKMTNADLDSWEGDTEDLAGHEEALSMRPALCERVFSSKHEAFVVGLTLGGRNPPPSREAEL